MDPAAATGVARCALVVFDGLRYLILHLHWNVRVCNMLRLLGPFLLRFGGAQAAVRMLAPFMLLLFLFVLPSMVCRHVDH